MHVCNRCGKENQEHYKFCLGCGSEIGDPAPPAAVAPAVAPGIDRGWAVNTPPPIALTVPAQAAAAVRGVAPAPARPISYPPIARSLLAVTSPGGLESTSRPCPTCGNQVPNSFVFCGQCGSRLVEPSPVASPAPVASAASVRGKLVLIRPDGSEGGSQPLVNGTNRIGRGVGALFDGDSYLSPHHADLVVNPSAIAVRDTNSLNGVFVKITEEEEVADGEVFRIGQELLRFDVIRAPQPLEDGTEVMGSPNPGYWGRLALVIGQDQDGSAFPLFGDAVVLGRERGDILFPEDGYVSGTHARISYRGGRFYLGDLNSSNGTFLRIRGERVVRSGTFLLMGQQLFRAQI